MPISESPIPKEARRITLSVTIVILDSFEGILDNPSLTTSIMCLLSRTNLSGSRDLTIANIPTDIKRNAITKEQAIQQPPIRAHSEMHDTHLYMQEVLKQLSDLEVESIQL